MAGKVKLTAKDKEAIAREKERDEADLEEQQRRLEFYQLFQPSPVFAQLDAALKQDKVFHAYLFHGPRGSLKEEAAQLFAASIMTGSKGLLKESEADKETKTAVSQIYRGDHSDFIFLNGGRKEAIKKEEVDEIQHRFSMTASAALGRKVYLLAPLIKNRKGHYKELFETVLKKGYLYVRVDGELMEVERGMKLDRYKNHSIEVVVDRLIVKETGDKRLQNSVANTLKQGDGLMMVYDVQNETIRHYSRRLMCPTSGISYSDPAPHDFSFNSPQGACPRCKGLGYVSLIDRDLIIPDRSLSIHDGAIVPLGKWKKTEASNACASQQKRQRPRTTTIAPTRDWLNTFVRLRKTTRALRHRSGWDSSAAIASVLYVTASVSISKPCTSASPARTLPNWPRWI